VSSKFSLNVSDARKVLLSQKYFCMQESTFPGWKNRAREQVDQAKVYGDFRLLTRAVPRLQKAFKNGIV